MRSDMFEVIIERPRWNVGRGRKGRAKELARVHPELAPQWEAVSIGRGTKSLNENWAPLRRFLLRRVGRPWNAVHAEICEHIAVGSAEQKRVRDHLTDFVEMHAVMIDGIPHHPIACGSQRNRYTPVGTYRRRPFYVCPRTGLLLLARRAKRQS